MKKTTNSSIGTSFFNETIRTSVQNLKRILGEPTYDSNDGTDKVNFEWVCENSKGNTVTIYDWKNYRQINEKELIEWHIGGFNKNATETAKQDLLTLL